MLRASALRRVPVRSSLHGQVPGGPAGGLPHHSDYPLELLLARKGGRSISVCLPARDESATIGAIVSSIHDHFIARSALVDQVVVVDHGSRDDTAAIATAAGATVYRADDLLPEFGTTLGKGDVLWRSVAASHGEIIVWLDADLEQFDAHYVTGLLGPLLCDPQIALVRATYERRLGGVAGEGGRVTELLARPIIGTLFPALAHIRQPLGGEYAIRRDVAEALPFEPDYGVEMGLLLDVAATYGVAAITQVDLGERTHRNRSLTELREQSRQVLRAVLSRTPAAESVRGGSVLRPALSTVAHRAEIAV